MDLFNTTPKSAARTLRALARLIDYPGPELRAHLPQIRDALHSDGALGNTRLAELSALLGQIARQDPLDAEAEYVHLFDRGRTTALYLFEHVHGDSRDRGPALIDLAQTYEKAGLYLAEGEMPDHLPVLLEFASTQPPREARALLGEIAHILGAIFNALQKRSSPYASAIGALVDLAGEPARPAPSAEDEPLDATWAEPAAFGGCTNAGQSSPRPEQPIQIVRRETRRPGAAA